MFGLLPKIAQAAADLAPLKRFIGKVEVVILNPLIKLGMVVALIVFLYGIFEFLRDGASSEGRKKGGQHILWGLIGIFIMVAAGGIMNVICGSWGIAGNCNPFTQ